MDIATASVYEHEIAKNDDFQFGFESVIRNTALLDRMLVSADTDYIVGGAISPAPDTLALCVGPLWGNGRSLALPVFSAAATEPIPLAAPVGDSRVDTLQARGVLEEYDTQRRAFFDPETSGGQYFNTPTKQRLKIEWMILQGVEGQDMAPEAEAGWLKLAEILVEPGMAVLPEENIRAVSAIYQGEENGAWTNQRARTFFLGSFLALKTILALEHTITGRHREQVIKASNIHFGIGANQVNGKSMPLGEGQTAGTEAFLATDSLFTSLMKEAGYRRANVAALDAIINDILETIADMVHEAPDDGALYGRKNKTWVEVPGSGGGSGGEAVEAVKLYSKKTLTLTNTRIVDRRKRGWDIGLPYLSPASRIYHFDTDMNDQYQETNIEIGHASGNAPGLAGTDETNGQVYFNPAVLAVPPYEMKGRSLYGFFSLKSEPRTSTHTATAEAWIRLFGNRPSVLLRFGSPIEEIVLRLGVKGAQETEYSASEADAVSYSEPDPPLEYSAAADDDNIPYSASESDGIGYSGSDEPLEFSAAGADIGNALIHTWQNGSEAASLDDMGIALPTKTWIHIAATATPNAISLFIGHSRVDFEKQAAAPHLMAVEINPSQEELNADELLLDESAAVIFDDFKANTDNRVPYAALDYRDKCLVLEAQDPAKVKTNLFETEQFRAAVLAVVNTMN